MRQLRLIVSDWGAFICLNVEAVPVRMNNLRSAPFFASLDGVVEEAVEFMQSDSLMLVTTADLHSILALGFWNPHSIVE